jgi:hypothetical protein
MQVLDPFSSASETAKRQLSGENGNAGTWFTFGLIFFMQACVEGGAGGGGCNGFNNIGKLGKLGGSGSSSSGGAGGAEEFMHTMGRPAGAMPEFDKIFSWLTPGLIVIFVIAVLFLALLGAAIGSVGQGMAIAAVATGKPELAMTDRVKLTAMRMFKTHMFFWVIGMLAFVPMAITIFLVLFNSATGPVFANANFENANWGALVGVGALSMLLFIPLGFFAAFMRNFAAPIVYHRGCTMMQAYSSITRAPGFSWVNILGAYLLRFLVSIVAGIVAVLALCTCVGALPVIAQTILAPFYIFERAHTMHMLASLGPEFNVMSGEPAAFDGFGPGGFTPAHQGPGQGPGPAPYGY